jgi:hypothetical protein
MGERPARLTAGAAVLLALTIALVGCSGQGGSVTSPTSLGSVGAGGATGTGTGLVAGPQVATMRDYTATILPTSVTEGSTTSFSVTITNSVSTNNGQTMKSAKITVPTTPPPGFTAVSSLAVTPPSGKHWTVSLVSGTIQLTANNGNNDALVAGESLTVTFTATAPDVACDTSPAYQWTTVGYNGTDFSTAYVLVGSQPSVTVTGATCQTACIGQQGQGYWKNHADAWPVTNLTLGTVSYNQAQLLSILNQPAAPGNGLVILAYQLIAAKLNAAKLSDTSMATTIAAADGLIGSLVVPPVGTDSLSPATVESVKDALEAYNEACGS